MKCWIKSCRYVLTAGVLLLAATWGAQAQLTIEITGVPGSGVTTWSFDGESATSQADTLTTDTTSPILLPSGFASGSTGIVAIFGVTVMSEWDIFMFDRIRITQGESGDSLELWPDMTWSYESGAQVLWFGYIEDVAIDISILNPGTYITSAEPSYALPGGVVVTVTSTPEPSALGLVAAVAFGALAWRRRR